MFLPPPPNHLPRLTKLHLPVSFETLYPPQKPLHRPNNMRHPTRIRMHQHWKHGLLFILADPQEPVVPQVLDHPDVRVAVGVGRVREVLQGGHVFHVPVAWEAG